MRDETKDSGDAGMNTATLAELYVSQGFLKKAFTIYRQLVDSDPFNDELRRRLYELKQLIDADNAQARQNSLSLQRPSGDPAGCSVEVKDCGGKAGGETVLATLERWLSVIERRR